MFDFTRDAAVECRCIERLDTRDPVAALQQRFPGLLRGVANRGQETDSSDYNSAGNNASPSGSQERVPNRPMRRSSSDGLNRQVVQSIAMFIAESGSFAQGICYFFLLSM